MEDHYHDYVNVRVGVGPRTTHLYPPKDNFDRDRHDGVFISSQSHYTGYPMASSSSKDYPVGVLGVYSFGLGDGDGEGGVDTRTTHLT